MAGLAGGGGDSDADLPALHAGGRSSFGKENPELAAHNTQLGDAEPREILRDLLLLVPIIGLVCTPGSSPTPTALHRGPGCYASIVMAAGAWSPPEKRLIRNGPSRSRWMAPAAAPGPAPGP